MIAFAHISDLHVDGQERVAERAQRVMTYVNQLRDPIAAVIITGDIALHGLPSEYAEARRLLASRVPVLTLPGNHDVREHYQVAFLGEPFVAGPVNRLERVGTVTFALCDASIPGPDDGPQTNETLAWLERALDDSDPESPVFVCLHHPPVMPDTDPADRLRQQSERRLADIVERHRNIVALLCGHAHYPADTTFAGRPVLVAPGVAATLTVGLEAGNGELDYLLPPAVAFHRLDPHWRITTQYRLLD